MDRFLFLDILAVCVIVVLGLCISVDFRAAVFGLVGVKPLLDRHPGAEVFALDFTFAGYGDLHAEYSRMQQHIRTYSRFRQLDEQRLALAYARALGGITEREVRAQLAARN
jgi:hypothetical protein